MSGETDQSGYDKALRLVEELDAALLANPSATLTLERWCEEHKLVTIRPVIVKAQLVERGERPATAEQQDRLRVSPMQMLHYRRVRLHCEGIVLSDAENWYVPERLTPEMKKILAETDTSFGRVVQPLNFRRQTLASVRLLPSEIRRNSQTGALPDHVPDHVLEHRAILVSADGLPFSDLAERYTRAVLGPCGQAPGSHASVGSGCAPG